MPRPVHFEIQARDPQRASRFYEIVFGWNVEQWGDNPYWLITTGESTEAGINGGLMPRRGPDPTADGPVSAFVITMAVDDLDAKLKVVQEEGGSIAVPKAAVAGVGLLAYCKDTEGNLFGMLQPEPSSG